MPCPARPGQGRRAAGSAQDDFLSGALRPGDREIRLPGEASAARERRGAAQGLLIARGLWAEIMKLARGLGVAHRLLEVWTPAAEGPDDG